MPPRPSPKWRPLNPAFTKRNRFLSRLKPTDLDDDAQMDRLLQDKKFRRLLHSGPNPWERTLALSAEFPPPSRPTPSGDLVAVLAERWDDVISRPAVYDRVLLSLQQVSLTSLTADELQVIERFIRKVIFRLAHGKIHWRMMMKFAEYASVTLRRYATPTVVADDDVDRATSHQLHAEAIAAAASVGGLSDTTMALSSSVLSSTSSAFDAATGVHEDAFARHFDADDVDRLAQARDSAPFSALPQRGANSDTLRAGEEWLGGGWDGGEDPEDDDTSSRRPRRRATHDLFDVPMALRGISSSRGSSLRRLRAAADAEATYAISTPLGGLSGRLSDALFGGMGIPAAGLPIPAAAAGPRASAAAVERYLSVVYYGLDVCAARAAAVVEAAPDLIDDHPTGNRGTVWTRIMRLACIVADVDAVVPLPPEATPAAADAAPPGEEVHPDRVVPGRARPLAARLIEASAARRAAAIETGSGGVAGAASAATAPVDSPPAADASTAVSEPWRAVGATTASHALHVWGGIPSVQISAFSNRPYADVSASPHLAASAMDAPPPSTARLGEGTRGEGADTGASEGAVDLGLGGVTAGTGSGRWNPKGSTDSVATAAGSSVSPGYPQVLDARGGEAGAERERVYRDGPLRGVHATGSDLPPTPHTLSASVDRLLTAAVYVGGVRHNVLTGFNALDLMRALVGGYYSGRLPPGFVTAAAEEVASRVALPMLPQRLDLMATLAMHMSVLGVATDERLDTLVEAFTGAMGAVSLASQTDPAYSGGAMLWALARAGRADTIAFGRVADELASRVAHPRRRRPHIEARTDIAAEDLGQPLSRPLMRASSASIATLLWAVVAAAPSLSPNVRPGGAFWREVHLVVRERQRLQHMTPGGPGTHLTLPGGTPSTLRAEDVAVIGWAFAVTGQVQHAAEILAPLAEALPQIPAERFPPMAALVFEWAWRLIVESSVAAVPDEFAEGPLLRARVAAASLFCGEGASDAMRGVETASLVEAMLARDPRYERLAAPTRWRAGGLAAPLATVAVGGEGGDNGATDALLDKLEDAFAAYHCAFGTLPRASRTARDIVAWCGVAGNLGRGFRRETADESEEAGAAQLAVPPAGVLGAHTALRGGIAAVDAPSLTELVGTDVAAWPVVADAAEGDTSRVLAAYIPVDVLRIFGRDVDRTERLAMAAFGLPQHAAVEASATAFSDTHIDTLDIDVDRFDSRLRMPTTAIWPHARENLRTGEGMSDAEAGEAAVATRVAKEAAAAAEMQAEDEFRASRGRAAHVIARIDAEDAK